MPGMSSKVLVAGAINTDLVATVERAPAAGETVTGHAFAIHGGGKGANQAVAAARSGASVALLSGAGSDAFGEERLDGLKNDGIDTTWVIQSSAAPSGVALIFVEKSGENRIVCVPGANLDVPAEIAGTVVAACAPGWVLATNELEPGTVRALLESAHRARIPVLFNATPDPETSAPLLPYVDMLIVNEGEATALLGGEQFDDPRETIGALRALGVETVVMTVGASGAYAGNQDVIVHHRPPTVAVVDTTGAGDTFCGALVAELARGGDLEDAVRYGVAASALSTTRQGAQSSIPWRRDVHVEEWQDRSR